MIKHEFYTNLDRVGLSYFLNHYGEYMPELFDEEEVNEALEELSKDEGLLDDISDLIFSQVQRKILMKKYKK